MAAIFVKRAVDMVADDVRARILSGAFPVGSRLPPERALAVELGINRLTLRAALARLEADGLVRPRQGDGVVVLDYHATADVDLLPHLVASEDLSLTGSFLELRRAVAAEAVALATIRATKADLDGLERLAQAQAAETDDRTFARRDLEFARALLKAARNLPMELLLNTIERTYLALPQLSEALYADRPAVVASYQGLVALLRAGDPDQARNLVRGALEAIDRDALEILKPKVAKKKRSKKRGPS